MNCLDYCSSCKIKLEINLGDFEDLTVEDVIGFKCPACNTITLFEGIEEYYKQEEPDVNPYTDCRIELGEIVS